METFFGLISSLSFIALIVGLIKPSLVKMSSRKRAGMIFGGAWIVLSIIFGTTIPSTPSSAPTTNPPAPQAIGNAIQQSASSSGGAQIAATPRLSQPTAQTSSPSLAKANSVTTTGSCVIDGAYPDPRCTPGAAFSDVTAAEVCTSGYSSSVRDVPESEKNQAYAEYGITSHTTGQYEVDHFIPLEIGGSNDIANLWPEAASPTPGFHEKDKVENYLHSQVCSGQMTLSQAQQAIAANWLTIYNNVHGGVTASTTSAPAPVATSNTTTQVQSTSVQTGATAQCNDGTYSYSQTRSGTCSRHGGVAKWY